MRSNALFRQLRLSWDALNAGWNEWVLGYGRDSQRALLARLGLPDADWRKLTLTLSILLVTLLAALSAYLAWQYRRQPADPAARLYARFCAKMARWKLPRRPHEGPLDYARRMSGAPEPLAAGVAGITRLYVQLRYEPDPAAADIVRLKQLVRKLRR